MTVTGKSEAAMELLQEEFADDDIYSKKRAAGRLHLVATALGPEGTATKLIPWLNERVRASEADEIVFLLAGQVSLLVKLVESASVLLDCLEPLLGWDETCVRDAALEAAKAVVTELTPAQVKEQFLPILSNLASSSWFTGKVSACGLIAPALLKIDDDDMRTGVKELYETLSKDDMPMVRRSAANALSAVGAQWPQGVTVELMKLYIELCGDIQESVRAAAIEETAALCGMMTETQIVDTGLLNKIKEFMIDPSWRVRAIMSEDFAGIAKAVGNKHLKSDLLPLFVELLRDQEGEVRSVASKQILPLMALLDTESFVNSVLPVLTELLARDAHAPVRQQLAQVSVNPLLFEKLGNSQVETKLVPAWEELLKREVPGLPEVRLHVLKGLETIADTMGSAFMTDPGSGWGRLLKNMFSSSKSKAMDAAAEDIDHPQWRLRQSILNSLDTLAKANNENANAFILNLWYEGLSDEVYAVRTTAAKLLNQFCQEDSNVGLSQVSERFLPKLLQFIALAKGTEKKWGKSVKPNFLHRLVFLHAAFAVTEYQEVWEPLVPHCKDALHDKVPNVRLLVCKYLCEAKPEIRDLFTTDLEELLNDADCDVVASAKAALAR